MPRPTTRPWWMITAISSASGMPMARTAAANTTVFVSARRNDGSRKIVT